MIVLFWLLLLSTEGARLYHPVTIDTLAASHHTHVVLTGQVAFTRRESDGDWHIRLVDLHGHWVVVEVIPAIPLPVPERGSNIRVWGIRRFDNERGHGWLEIHPAERIEIIP